MTRKRFVKLLMSKGHRRNEANLIASKRPDKWSYEKYYHSSMVTLPSLSKEIAKSYREIVNGVTSALNEICKKSGKALKMWGRTLEDFEFSPIPEEEGLEE